MSAAVAPAPGAYLVCMRRDTVASVRHVAEEGRAICTAGVNGVYDGATSRRGIWTLVGPELVATDCERCANVLLNRQHELPSTIPTTSARTFGSDGTPHGYFHHVVDSGRKRARILCSNDAIGSDGLAYAHDDPKRRCPDCALATGERATLTVYALLCGLTVPGALERCKAQQALLSSPVPRSVA